jgi:hypothetical protein
MNFNRLVLFIAFNLSFVIPSAFSTPTLQTLESFINEQVGSYPFSTDNRFKLSAYAEMKGHFSAETEAFLLDFAGLGSISFFENHCLLKTTGQQVFVLKRYELNWVHTSVVNQALHQIFEQIALLANHNAVQDHVMFVNKWLARKNIEPFDKIYTRHILLRYGRYNQEQQRVEFHSDWVPDEATTDAATDEESMVKKHFSRLRITLDSLGLRGYYLDAGGEVYVNDVARDVHYATGEQYGQNVSAFKLFVQKLFVQSVQYVSNWDIKQRKSVVRQAADMANVKQLYTHQSWIPMMLSLLRANRVNIGDADVVCYFVDQPYYPSIYDQMTLKERAKADSYTQNRAKSSGTVEIEFSQATK